MSTQRQEGNYWVKIPAWSEDWVVGYFDGNWNYRGMDSDSDSSIMPTEIDPYRIPNPDEAGKIYQDEKRQVWKLQNAEGVQIISDDPNRKTFLNQVFGEPYKSPDAQGRAWVDGYEMSDKAAYLLLQKKFEKHPALEENISEHYSHLPDGSPELAKWLQMLGVKTREEAIELLGIK